MHTRTLARTRRHTHIPDVGSSYSVGNIFKTYLHFQKKTKNNNNFETLQKSQFCLPLLPKSSVWYQRRCNITNNTKIIPVIKVQIYINWSFVCCSSRKGDVLCKFLVHIMLTWQCWFSGPCRRPTDIERRCRGRHPAACTV